ncbi:olfactory receptor 52K1-like [Denticeps clupeoides]|uniref:olfactory receptor 52K1-like n=1 Tax=Denticeps clupeoides TaxID=299321 RepID=UPI0010A34DA9|nr:olfactory receptor 52K1-like [Denticeps clupeoides]XP_028857429.1 olfactory receptor 52K1-like [Denticeps clupeoides]
MSLIKNASFSDFVLNGFSDLGHWRPLLSIPFLFMFLFSLVANATLLYVIISQKALHYPMCVLIAVMTAVDMCLPIFFVPKMLLSLLLGWTSISLQACLLQMFFLHFVGTFQTTVLVWMALDRYFAICTPLHYQKYMAASYFLRFVVGPVLRNLLMILLIVGRAGRLSYCRENVMEHCFCEHMALVQLACDDTSLSNVAGLFIIFFITIADLLFVMISYMVIFVTVFRSGKSRMKALDTCVTHILVMSTGLVFALVALLSYRIRNNISPSVRVFLSTMYLLFGSFANPIIYGVRTKDIREHFVKLVKGARVMPT